MVTHGLLEAAYYQTLPSKGHRRPLSLISATLVCPKPLMLVSWPTESQGRLSAIRSALTGPTCGNPSRALYGLLFKSMQSAACCSSPTVEVLAPGQAFRFSSAPSKAIKTGA